MFDEITLHNFNRPLAQRAESRKFCGPYRWTPSKPNNGRGFYCDGNEQCGDGPIRLRLEEANDHISSRLSDTLGYYCDPCAAGETLQPIIARLPRGRGFLAGWKMGPNMCAMLDSDIHETERDAALAAHGFAERDAENMRDSYEEPEE